MGHAVKHINRIQVYQRDPTRTTVLRNRFAKEMRKRFRWLRGVINSAIIDKDVFGLSDDPLQIRRLQANVDANVGRKAFDFPRNQDKVSAFMEWLDGQVDEGILEVSNRQRIGQSIDETWQNVFIDDSYKRGVQRASLEMQKQEFNILPIDERGGLQAVMGQPTHADRLGVMYTRSFNELKGITDAMDQQISRVLAQGLADGDGPRLIARKLNATISGKGIGDLGITDSLGRFIPAERRAQIMARTEIIRAHHHGMIQEYRNFGVEGVKVQAEFRTAGDDRVCLECESLEGEVFTLDQAQNLIPVHPMCRCIVLPFRANRDTSITGRTSVSDRSPEEILEDV